MLSYNSMRICVLLLDKLLHVYIYPTFPMYSKSWEFKVFEIALLYSFNSSKVVLYGNFTNDRIYAQNPKFNSINIGTQS